MKKLFLTMLAVGGLMFTACEKEDGIGQADLDALHASYGSQVSALQDQLNAANGDISSLNGIIDDANAEIALLEGQVALDSETKAMLAEQISDLEAIIWDAEEQITSLQAENNSLSEALAAANEIIDNLNGNPITVTEFVTVVETVVETVLVGDQDAIDALNAQIEELSAALDLAELNSDGVSQEDLDALQALLDSAESSSAASEASYSDFISILQARISELEDAVRAAGDLVSSLGETIAGLQAANVAIQADLDAALASGVVDAATIESLQGELNAANEFAATLSGELENLAEANDITEAQLRDQIASLGETIADLEARLAVALDASTTTSVSTSTFEWDETRLGANTFDAADTDALDIILVTTTTTTTFNLDGDEIGSESSDSYSYVENNDAPAVEVTDPTDAGWATNGVYGGEVTQGEEFEANNVIASAASTEEFTTETYDIHRIDTTSAAGLTEVYGCSGECDGVETNGQTRQTQTAPASSETVVVSTGNTRTVDNPDYEEPATFDAKDLDQDNDVDFDDASAAGYTAVSNAAQFPLSGFFGVATDGTNEIFNEGFLTSAEALSAAQAAALSHYIDN